MKDKTKTYAAFGIALELVKDDYSEVAEMKCGYCGSDKHTTEYCPKTWNGQGNRSELYCSYCGRNDHNIDACIKKWPGKNPVIIKDR